MAEIFSLIVLVIIGVPLRGWVMSVVWAWFIVPTFNAPVLSIPMAMGVSLVVGAMTQQNTDTVKPERSRREAWAHLVTTAVGGPLLTLFVAWLIRLFI